MGYEIAHRSMSNDKNCIKIEMVKAEFTAYV